MPSYECNPWPKSAFIITTKSSNADSWTWTPEFLSTSLQFRYQGHCLAATICSSQACRLGSDEASDGESVVGKFTWRGVVHISPEGIDQILFVLGQFFFILLQTLQTKITAFTFAHSITIGLALFNIISLKPQMVELVMTLSIFPHSWTLKRGFWI